MNGEAQALRARRLALAAIEALDRSDYRAAANALIDAEREARRAADAQETGTP